MNDSSLPNSSASPPDSAPSPLFQIEVPFSELPTYDLLELPVDKMSPTQLRALASELQEHRVSPQKRATSLRKESNKLTGRKTKVKEVSINILDLFAEDDEPEAVS